jgi:hypothetical protein
MYWYCSCIVSSDEERPKVLRSITWNTASRNFANANSRRSWFYSSSRKENKRSYFTFNTAHTAITWYLIEKGLKWASVVGYLFCINLASPYCLHIFTGQRIDYVQLINSHTNSTWLEGQLRADGCLRNVETEHFLANQLPIVLILCTTG